MRLARLLVVAFVMHMGAAVADASEAGAARHLIYLHGRIIQEAQSARPHHPRFGHYELELIRGAFRDRGFQLTSEVRPKSISVSDAADRVVDQVRSLLATGVAPERITVVGASMGGGIALLAATRLQNPGLRFGVLGVCFSKNVRTLEASEGHAPAGRILEIREKSDDYSEPCPSFDEERPGLQAREVVLETGLAHGFLYTPLSEWMDPVVEWAHALSSATR